MYQMTTDPKPVLYGGGLMPLGGPEETAGYKGYGLAMLVEIFCGILGNASYGPNIRRWMNTDREANLVWHVSYVHFPNNETYIKIKIVSPFLTQYKLHSLKQIHSLKKSQ